LVQIKRDCKLVALAVSDDGLAVAAGDESGKIYYVTNPVGSTSLIVQTLHWHASQVSSLAFIRETPLLISGGIEAVLVQWHLEKQERAFVSRVGNGILNFSLSQNYYAMTLADNTVKVVRIDNNKIVMSSKQLHISST
jgi:WD40 repeat protein